MRGSASNNCAVQGGPTPKGDVYLCFGATNP